jgi:cysteine desulfurase
MNMANSTVDMLSLSGHKLRAKGHRALYLQGSALPAFHGWRSSGSRRAGTENAAGIIALGKACEMAGDFLEEENTKV